MGLNGKYTDYGPDWLHRPTPSPSRKREGNFWEVPSRLNPARCHRKPGAFQSRGNRGSTQCQLRGIG